MFPVVRFSPNLLHICVSPNRHKNQRFAGFKAKVLHGEGLMHPKIRQAMMATGFTP